MFHENASNARNTGKGVARARRAPLFRSLDSSPRAPPLACVCGAATQSGDRRSSDRPTARTTDLLATACRRASSPGAGKSHRPIAVSVDAEAVARAVHVTENLE